MKRYMRGLTAIIISASFIMGGAASVGATCAGATITNTGPDSTNEIICVDSSQVSVKCVNNVNVVTSSTQTGTSGGSTNGGNTNGGSSITGNATNENGVVVQIGAACGAQPVTPAATTPTPTPPAAGKGAGAGAAAPVAALPNTASNTVARDLAIGVVTLIGLLGLSRIAVMVYRQLALR